MSYFSTKECVMNGVELLDNKFPEWKELVDLDKLDIENCDNCILGQLFGDYIAGLDTLRIGQHKAYIFGFNVDTSFDVVPDPNLGDYLNLKNHWQKTIAELMTAPLAL